ncbi:hypothetical protein TNCV_1327031 [Trichonephila clavipes]|nr:hypothetical protein TNCV_1327031 [Trichonephila clavipes]
MSHHKAPLSLPISGLSDSSIDPSRIDSSVQYGLLFELLLAASLVGLNSTPHIHCCFQSSSSRYVWGCSSRCRFLSLTCLSLFVIPQYGQRPDLPDRTHVSSDASAPRDEQRLDFLDRICLLLTASAPRGEQGLDFPDSTSISLSASIRVIFLVDGPEGIEVGTLLFLHL